VIVNQVGKNEIHHPSGLPDAPNHTIEHLNVKNFRGEDAPRPPYMLAPYGRSKPSPT